MKQRNFYWLSMLALLVWLGVWHSAPSAQTQTKPRETASPLPDFDLRNQSINRAEPAPDAPKLWGLQRPLSPTSTAAPNVIARRFAQSYATPLRLTAADVNALTVAREYRTDHNGLTHVTLQQAHRGIPVFEGEFTAHIARNGEVMAASSTLTNRLAETVNATEPTLTAPQALRIAGDYAQANQYTRDVTPELVYFPLTDDHTRLAWQMTLWLRDAPDVYLIVVDAERGSLLYRRNLTSYERANYEQAQSG
ncbi:MAG: hypothetical protein HOP19_04100, partial [Acidobacteria bacterium]|nr:hypothetical protein [Acidobacteriota bacterium]